MWVWGYVRQVVLFGPPRDFTLKQPRNRSNTRRNPANETEMDGAVAMKHPPRLGYRCGHAIGGYYSNSLYAAL